MRIALAADHAGFELKSRLAEDLRRAGHEVEDLGAHKFAGDDDYTDYAEALARAVAEGRAPRGILICGSGVGATVAANKIRGVRACVCHDTYSAHQGVEHDDVNVLVLGARIVGLALATELVGTFLGASFSGEERHVRRLRKIARLEGST
jgi:RpiB/LacA/LacB family sugar-phosphate isomerase